MGPFSGVILSLIHVSAPWDQYALVGFNLIGRSKPAPAGGYPLHDKRNGSETPNERTVQRRSTSPIFWKFITATGSADFAAPPLMPSVKSPRPAVGERHGDNADESETLVQKDENAELPIGRTEKPLNGSGDVPCEDIDDDSRKHLSTV